MQSVARVPDRFWFKTCHGKLRRRAVSEARQIGPHSRGLQLVRYPAELEIRTFVLAVDYG